MQIIIHSSIIYFFITSFLIGIGYSQGQSFSDEHLDIFGNLDNNEFNHNIGSSGEQNPYDDSIATSSSVNPQYLSPDVVPTNTSPPFIVTATRVDTPQYIYPEETPKALFVTTEAPAVEEEDSQIAQPDFSPEQTDLDVEVPTESQTQLDQDEAETTQVPMEETTLQDIDDGLPANYDNLGEVSNDLNTDTEGENDDNETDTDNQAQLPEPLPTPIALISSNGEGSNPPLEEEFAEAFKRVGPNGRRVRPGGGRRRVRMRVRKVKKDNSTLSSMENSTPYSLQSQGQDGSNDWMDNNNGFETTTTVRPRRYRSTTQAPDLISPIIPANNAGSPSVVKNGPKPMIITDIHSGSTGLNPITSEPQLEKPVLGGYTEKISTYFVSPPARISTTEAPKLPTNLSIDDPDLNSIGDSKPLDSVIQDKSSLFEKQGEIWGTNSMEPMPTSFYPTSTESSDRTSSFATPPKSAIESSLINDNVENSLQQPPMQDRTYTVTEQTINGNNGFDQGNSFGPSSEGQGTSQSNAFINPFGFGGDSENHAESSNNPSQQSFPLSPFNQYQPNLPFATPGQVNRPTGSHYDRTKDQFLNGYQQQFFKDNTVYNSNDQSNSLKSSIAFNQPNSPDHHDSQHHGPPFDHNSFASASPPNGDEYFNNPSQNGIIDHQHGNFPSQAIKDAHNEHGIVFDKIIDYNEGFKSSPDDSTLHGGKPYPPPFRKVPSFSGSDFTYDGPSNSPSGPNVFSQDGPSHNGVSGPDEFSGNLHNYPPSREGFPDTSPTSFNTPSGFPHFSGGGPPDQGGFLQGPQNSNPPNGLSGYSSGNHGNPITVGTDPSTFPQSSPPEAIRSLQPSTGPVFGTVESVPAYDHNGGDQNNIQSQNGNPGNYPVFVANSPGEPSRNPTFLPQRPQGPPPQSAYQRGLNFLRNNFRPPGGPPMHSHQPRFFPGRPSGQDYRGEPSSHPNNFRGNPGPLGPLGRPPPDFQGSPPLMSEQHGRPPPDFHSGSPHVHLPLPGLQGIPHPPSEQQALSEVSPIHHFPPHTHSMSSKPDYEPANPPLPHGHPLENHFDLFPGGNNGEHGNGPHENHLNNFQNSNSGGQLESSTGDTHLTAPSHSDDHGPGTNGPDFDVLSAYFDKPPPTVANDYNNEYRMKERPVDDESKDNELANVPYQYSSTDGGGLDGGPFFHNYEPGKDKPTKVNFPGSNKPDDYEPETQSQQAEEKNKTSVYSDTPYVLMFPQLVPQEAMIPPPPKMLTKEIPVVSASSMSAMRFTPEGKPVLGPGLKAVPVHPRYQMYQVLAKAHYEKTMQKYMESKKKPPSAIYTPYGVLVPMGPSGSASTNHETYATMASKPQGKYHRHKPHDKQLLNLLLGKPSNLLGRLEVNKGIKNGRLKKHFDFKANVDPALDLLAEKLAIKLGAVKYVLTSPTKVGIHAYTKHTASYSELNPVTVPKPGSKDKGETSIFGSSKGFLDSINQEKGKSHSNSESSQSEGKSLQENTELKQRLKALLKERLKEVLDEVEVESQEHENLSPRSGRQSSINNNNNIMMMPMESSIVETKVAPPNSNVFTNYFNQNSNTGNNGGLIGTIKRLFSFGGTDNSRSEGTNGIGRSEGGGLSNLLSPSRNNSSNHPFAWYGLALNSIGRMGSSILHPGPAQDEYLKTTHKFKSEKKATKQLEKWLDIVLKSSETSSASTGQKPLDLKSSPSILSERTRNLKQMYYGNPLTSAASLQSSVKIVPPTKLTQASNPKPPENLLKRLGEPTGTVSSAVLTNTWTPVVSAFKTVFNIKNPTVLKQKIL